jgi:hypothetical protein
VSLIPLASLLARVCNVKEVALLKREFLRSLRTVRVKCANDFLGRKDCRRGLGYGWKRKWCRNLESRAILISIERFPERLHWESLLGRRGRKGRRRCEKGRM